MPNDEEKDKGTSIGFEAGRFDVTDKLCSTGQIAHDEAHAMHRA